MLHSAVNFLSEMSPSYKSEIKHTAPEGVIPTSALTVLWFSNLKLLVAEQLHLKAF